MAKLNAAKAKKARISYEKWNQYFKANIDLYHMMHTFVLGQQWSDEEEDTMIQTYRKVPLTSNKLATLANSLLGEQQQNTPQLEVVPMSNCTEETAKMYDIILKDIIFSSESTDAFQTAAMQAAIGGYGAVLIDTAYVHSHSFDLDITFHDFKDATYCFWDIGAEEKSKIDGMYCGYITRVSRERFRQIYGRETERKIKESSGITQTEEEIALATQPEDNDSPFNWADSDGITILDYYERKNTSDVLYKLSNGVILNQFEMDDMIADSMRRAQEMQMMEMQAIAQDAQSEYMDVEMESTLSPDTIPLYYKNEVVRIEDKKNIKKHKIMHYKFAGDYELESGEFPSESLPLIFVDQLSYFNKEAKQCTRSFLGDCKDTQRYINYLRTQSAYILKVSRYDQWIGSKKNVAGLDTQRNWRDPNSIQGMLTFDESPSGITPTQVRPPELSASLFQQYELAIQDLYTSTGLYPTRMGQQGNEVSGAAIDARTRQGSYSTFTFFNSINKAISAAGQIVNEMIPRVYDSERVLTLMIPDKGMQNITINKQEDEYGQRIENDIRSGSYDVRLKPGPSYEGQKQVALQSFNQVLQASPQTFNMIADLYAENLPLMNNIEIKNRLKTLVPPEIIQAGKTGDVPQQQVPNPEQQAMMQKQQYNEALLQIKQEELELKKQQILLDAQAKMQELETERLLAASELQEQELRFVAQMDRTRSDAAISHADNMVKILTSGK